MRAIRFVGLATAALLLAAVSAHAQCANGQCRVPGRTIAPAPVLAPVILPAVLPPAVAAAPAPAVGWFWHGEDRDRVYLEVNGVELGSLDLRELRFTEASGKKWKPWPPPVPASIPKVGQIPPGGVRWDEIPDDGREHYSISGRPANRDTMFAAMGAGGDGKVPEDAAFPWVTVVGPDDVRAKVLKDFRENLYLIGLKVRVTAFPAGHRAVADFPPGVIHLQAPNGRLLFSLPTYPGPDKLGAAIATALDNYDASKDPGPGKPYPKLEPPAPTPAPNPLADPKSPWRAVAIGAGLVVLILLTRTRS